MAPQLSNVESDSHHFPHWQVISFRIGKKGRPLSRRDPHRHMRKAMQERARQSLGRPLRRNADAALHNLLDQRAKLALGQPRADAALDAVSEGAVPTRILEAPI